MAIHVVPIIYNHTSKKILRWYVLDHAHQLNDPAFNPADLNERRFLIPLQLYQMLAGNDPSQPMLYKLQDYVNSNAP